MAHQDEAQNHGSRSPASLIDVMNEAGAATGHITITGPDDEVDHLVIVTRDKALAAALLEVLRAYDEINEYLDATENNA